MSILDKTYRIKGIHYTQQKKIGKTIKNRELWGSKM